MYSHLTLGGSGHCSHFMVYPRPFLNHVSLYISQNPGKISAQLRDYTSVLRMGYHNPTVDPGKHLVYEI